MGTDSEWEDWAQRDPYFGVLTSDTFRRANLTDEAKAEFFATGQKHVERVLQNVRHHLDPEFAPKRVLDFGCGTGRLVIPFSRVADEVLGLDIAPSMLKEARKNCDDAGVRNVTLALSDETLSAATGTFDLIHSFIVFQHIHPERVRHIVGLMLARLRDGGVGAIQVLYATRRYATAFGSVPKYRRVAAPLLAPAHRVRRRLRRALGFQVDPEMQMNPSQLNDLMYVLQTAGVHNLYADFTDHGGELGVFLYFQHKRTAPRTLWP